MIRRCSLASIVATLAWWSPMAAGAGPESRPAGDQKPPVASRAVPKIPAWRFASTKYQVPLIELYTSEESASSPPVERLLANLPRDGFGFDKVVPISYHVSHWAHLGWTDRFATEEFKKRQQFFVEANELPGPTAPQMFLNGQETSDRGNTLYMTLQDIGRRPPPIHLSLRVTLRQNGRRVEVIGLVDRSKIPGPNRDPSIVQVVLFETGLSSMVSSGENKGKTLEHVNVVRALAPERPMNPSDDLMHFGVEAPIGASWNRDRLGVAAFVMIVHDASIIQATGGLLDPAKAEMIDED